MNIALLGATGQLGHDLIPALHSHQVHAITRKDIDVTSFSHTRELLLSISPDVILNTTAYHRVDDCETNADLAYGVNALAVLNLVRIANDLGATLVHISTDYVFDGAARQPYTEDAIPFPLSVYANSKLSGEFLVRALCRKYFLIRTGGLYGSAGSRGKGGNFVETMIAKAKRGEPIRVVSDQVVTPTYTFDLAHQIARVLPLQEYGLYHMTNEGSCTWYEFAGAIFELSGIHADLAATTSGMYKTAALFWRTPVLNNLA
jgi:dTDP-4-dehydrorhamnose reductase